MGLPQIIVVSLVMVGVGIALAKHGEPRHDHNFFDSIISAVLWGSLLWWGGFFS